MHYFYIICVSTDEGWKYKVVMVHGRTQYEGRTDYLSHEDAKRAGFRACNVFHPEQGDKVNFEYRS